MMLLLHSGGVAQDIKFSGRCLFNLDVCRKGKLELGWRAKNQGFQKRPRADQSLPFGSYSIYMRNVARAVRQRRRVWALVIERRARACGFTGNQLNH